jgi:hypothetical protein
MMDKNMEQGKPKYSGKIAHVPLCSPQIFYMAWDPTLAAAVGSW